MFILIAEQVSFLFMFSLEPKLSSKYLVWNFLRYSRNEPLC